MLNGDNIGVPGFSSYSRRQWVIYIQACMMYLLWINIIWLHSRIYSIYIHTSLHRMFRYKFVWMEATTNISTHWNFSNWGTISAYRELVYSSLPMQPPPRCTSPPPWWVVAYATMTSLRWPAGTLRWLMGGTRYHHLVGRVMVLK